MKIFLYFVALAILTIIVQNAVVIEKIGAIKPQIKTEFVHDTIIITNTKEIKKLRHELRECEEHSARVDSNLKKALQMLYEK